MRFKLLIIASLIITHLHLSSQPLIMHFMDDFPEAAITHPGMFPSYEYSGSIPFLGFTGFDLSTNLPMSSLTGDIVNGTLTLDVNNLLEAMKSTTFMAFDFNMNLVTSTWVKNNLFFNVNLVNRISIDARLPKDLFVMGWRGNEPFIGDYADLSGIGADVLHYTELSYGITQKVGTKFTIGTKFKYLQGLSNISFYRSDLKLTTDTTTYWLTGQTDLQVDISGPLDTSGLTIQSYSDYMLNLRNPGFGIDIGITYRPVKFLRLSADIVDLGAIRFKTDVKSYSVHEASYQFRGLELGNSFNLSFDTILMDLLDTLSTTFSPTREEKPYLYYTTPKLYVGAELLLNKNNKFSFYYHRRFNPNYNYSALSAAYQRKFGQVLTTTVNYSYFAGNNHRVGAGLNLRMGMINLYFMTDDILDVIKPLRTQSANFYFGINFIHFTPTDKKIQKKDTKEREEERE